MKPRNYLGIGMIAMLVLICMGCSQENPTYGVYTAENEKTKTLQDIAGFVYLSIQSDSPYIGEEKVRIYDSKGALVVEKVVKEGVVVVIEDLTPGKYTAKVEGLCPPASGYNKKDFVVSQAESTQVVLDLRICI